jgi:hypothetical protein
MMDASRIDCSVVSSTRLFSAALAVRWFRASAAVPSVSTLKMMNRIVRRYLLIGFGGFHEAVAFQDPARFVNTPSPGTA